MLLIVNTASKCGFTPQFEGLEELHQTVWPEGLAVLGFPCNQFGDQDPGTNEEIGAFCQELRRQLSDDGEDRRQRLRRRSRCTSGSARRRRACWAARRSSGTSPSSWSGKDGQVIKRYAPPNTPASLAQRHRESPGRLRPEPPERSSGRPALLARLAFVQARQVGQGAARLVAKALFQPAYELTRSIRKLRKSVRCSHQAARVQTLPQ